MYAHYSVYHKLIVNIKYIVPVSKDAYSIRMFANGLNQLLNDNALVNKSGTQLGNSYVDELIK